jgi:hypothetical protein
MTKIKNKAFPKIIINVPVFVSKREPIGDAFPLTYDTLIDGAKKLIDKYNIDKQYLIINKENKVSQRQIGHIIYSEHLIGDRPALLLKINAHTFNRKGEHIKDDEVVSIETTDRIGDDTNYIFIVPAIVGEDNRLYNWFCFAYDDPSRESDEIITILKSVMKSIIRKPINNLKLPELLKELKDYPPEITLSLNSVELTQNSIKDKFDVFMTESKSFIKKEYKFSNMPIAEIEELVKDNFDKQFKKKILKFVSGRKEYKIKQEVENFKTGINLLVEKCFNFTEEIGIENHNKINDNDFILSLFTKVLDKYLLNGQD